MVIRCYFLINSAFKVRRPSKHFGQFSQSFRTSAICRASQPGLSFTEHTQYGSSQIVMPSQLRNSLARCTVGSSPSSQYSPATGLLITRTVQTSPYFSRVFFAATALAAPHENQTAILSPRLMLIPHPSQISISHSSSGWPHFLQAVMLLFFICVHLARISTATSDVQFVPRIFPERK